MQTLPRQDRSQAELKKKPHTYGPLRHPWPQEEFSHPLPKGSEKTVYTQRGKQQRDRR